MSRGGHANSGPTRDPMALRRLRASDRGGDVTYLPADGRQGETPAWPLVRPVRRELALWARLWALPQAVVWEANHQEIEVAVYVRTLSAAELPKAKIGLRNLARLQAEGLGLSLPGMRRFGWVIGPRLSVVQGGRDQAPAPDEAPSLRDRMRALEADP